MAQQTQQVEQQLARTLLQRREQYNDEEQGKAACAGGLCSEPETPPQQSHWHHADDARGQYVNIEKMEYVGQGAGGNFSLRAERRLNLCFSCCIVFLVLGIVCVAGAITYVQLERHHSWRLFWQKAEPPKTPTEMYFDCSDDYFNWEMAWSIPKQHFCCNKFGRGCPSPETSTDTYACTEGDVASWVLNKQNYCCSHYTLGCLQYDCIADRDDWQQKWSQPKKAFCCERFGEGCPFDCKADLASAETSWSDEQKQWCCHHQGTGCPKPAFLDKLHDARKTSHGAQEVTGQAAARSTNHTSLKIANDKQCSAICTHGGSTATCGSRIAWAAKHAFSGETSCEKAHELVQNECSQCHACFLIAENCHRAKNSSTMYGLSSQSGQDEARSESNASVTALTGHGLSLHHGQDEGRSEGNASITA
eukprot:TRINITY_DN28075_c0_g1_i1.p1 TRINITY_DN28075_c0_g1~~TRINITY_DN28075_c0_g1_i1.p1  ORF type:complete len:420 (+),score=81.98 TRINITY_DN28075_c0_g1_i1:66-1325(+)